MIGQIAVGKLTDGLDRTYLILVNQRADPEDDGSKDALEGYGGISADSRVICCPTQDSRQEVQAERKFGQRRPRRADWPRRQDNRSFGAVVRKAGRLAVVFERADGSNLTFVASLISRGVFAKSLQWRWSGQ